MTEHETARAVRATAQIGPCEVIEAEFVYGPSRCLRGASHQVQDDGEWFYTCDEHLAELGKGAAS